MPELRRGVSVEMKHRKYVKTMQFTDEGHDDVLFEGNIGRLIELSMPDCSVLEIWGRHGVVRVNVSFEEIEGMVNRLRSAKASNSELGSQKAPTNEV